MTPDVAVLGAGSWGTTLANLLARKGSRVRIWSYEAEVAELINGEHENPAYLPGVALDPALTALTDARAVVQGAGVVISVSPAQHVRGVVAAAGPSMRPDVILVSASKGIEQQSLATMDEVFTDVLPAPVARRATFLSGPSFAIEVAREQPTAVTVASRDEAAAMQVQSLFQTPYFRVYTSTDIVGVELGGALKNVVALAAGMAAGLGLGHNASAALMTRGLAEIARLAAARGANPLTLSGLAGMGDLILTCTGELSRNRHVGVELGRGRSLHQILDEMTMVAEGVHTARAAHALALQESIDMPIVAEVNAVLFGDTTARDALENLMLREPKPELWR
jgi:glycerol-3-phosphate dehydrogenase (NAD(P)+)